jgi:AraC-like DNA-binding protein
MPELQELYRCGGLELAYIGAGEGDAFPKHTHGEYVISAMLSGHEQVWLDGRRFTVTAGDFTVYNPEAVQASEFDPSTGGAEFVSLYLEPERLLRFAEENGWAGGHAAPEIGLPLIDDPALFGTLCAMGTAARHGDEEEIASLSQELMGRLLSCYSVGPVPGRSGPSCPFEALTDFMRAHVDRTLTLDELSQVGGISKYHLVRAFRERFGLSPIKYHMQLRLQEARRLLRLGQPAQDVAFALGFYDQSHFINAFRKVVGGTPLQYTLRS